MGLIIFGIVAFYLIMIIACVANSATQSRRYDERVEELKASGYKITYYNKQTGTLGYRKNGFYHSESVFRGYNAKHR